MLWITMWTSTRLDGMCYDVGCGTCSDTVALSWIRLLRSLTVYLVCTLNTCAHPSAWQFFELNFQIISAWRNPKKTLANVFSNYHNPCYSFATTFLNYDQRYRTDILDQLVDRPLSKGLISFVMDEATNCLCARSYSPGLV